MANARAKEVYEYLVSNNAETAQLIGKNEDVIRINWELENCRLTLYMDFDDSERSLHYEAVNYIKVPKSKCANVTQILNNFNSEYRWVKFVFDSEEDSITVKMDVILPDDYEAGDKMAYEAMVRVLSVSDDAYEELMEALWAKDF